MAHNEHRLLHFSIESPGGLDQIPSQPEENQPISMSEEDMKKRDYERNRKKEALAKKERPDREKELNEDIPDIERLIDEQPENSEELGEEPAEDENKEDREALINNPETLEQAISYIDGERSTLASPELKEVFDVAMARLTPKEKAAIYISDANYHDAIYKHIGANKGIPRSAIAINTGVFAESVILSALPEINAEQYETAAEKRTGQAIENDWKMSTDPAIRSIEAEALRKIQENTKAFIDNPSNSLHQKAAKEMRRAAEQDLKENGTIQINGKRDEKLADEEYVEEEASEDLSKYTNKVKQYLQKTVDKDIRVHLSEITGEDMKTSGYVFQLTNLKNMNAKIYKYLADNPNIEGVNVSKEGDLSKITFDSTSASAMENLLSSLYGEGNMNFKKITTTTP